MALPVNGVKTDRATLPQSAPTQHKRREGESFQSSLMSAGNVAEQSSGKTLFGSVKDFFVFLFNCITCGIFSSKKKKEPDVDPVKERKPSVPPRSAKSQEESLPTSKPTAADKPRSYPRPATFVETFDQVEKERQMQLDQLKAARQKAEEQIAKRREEVLASKAKEQVSEPAKPAEVPTQPTAVTVRAESKSSTSSAAPKAPERAAEERSQAESALRDKMKSERERMRLGAPKKPEFAEAEGRKFSHRATKEQIAYYSARGILRDPAKQIDVDVETLEGLYGLELDKVLRDVWCKDEELPNVSLKPIVNVYYRKDVAKILNIDSWDSSPKTLSYRDAFKFYIGGINVQIPGASESEEPLDEARTVELPPSHPIIAATSNMHHKGPYLPSMQTDGMSGKFVSMQTVVLQVLKDKGLIFDYYGYGASIIVRA